MGKTAPEARASAIIMDGPLSAMFPEADLRASQPVFLNNSGLVDTAAPVVGQGEIFFPFPATIVGVFGRLRNTVSAPVGVFVGTLEDPIKFVEHGLGVEDLEGSTFKADILNEGAVAAGEVVVFGSGNLSVSGVEALDARTLTKKTAREEREALEGNLTEGNLTGNLTTGNLTAQPRMTVPPKAPLTKVGAKLPPPKVETRTAGAGGVDLTVMWVPGTP